MSSVAERVDVVIVGAGMAGLSAARTLADRGLRPLLLEARDRVGGRIFTAKRHGVDVELGAEFVHGRAPELFALLDEFGLEAVERDGAMLRDDGTGLAEDDPQDDSMFAELERLGAPGTPDEPFAAWLAQQDLPRWQKQALLGYVEGFNAADAAVIGTHGLAAQQAAEDAIEGDRAWHVSGGYAQIAERLAARVRELGGEIRLQTEIERIDWKAGEVRLTLRDGSSVAANRCVLTLPLGVLQGVNTPEGMVIAPEPTATLQAARRMAMGQVSRFTLVFRSRWWERAAQSAVSADALRTMSFLFTPTAPVPVWWTREPEDHDAATATLVGWCGGPRSASLIAMKDEELTVVAVKALAETFAIDPATVRGELLSLDRHNWSADPFSRGAYSYVPAGALDAPRKLAEPVADTLFFAGEHTDLTAHWGTVHAAIRSGLRAAMQVLGEPAL